MPVRPPRLAGPRPPRAALLAAPIVLVIAAAAWFFVFRGPRAIGGATQADVQWRIPAQLTEERQFALRVAGGVDGHAAVRTQLRTGTGAAAACPASPPDDASRRVLLDRDDPDQDLGRSIADLQTFAADASGAVRLCGWLLANSPAGDGAVVARLDRTARVLPAPASLTVSRRTKVRAAVTFPLRAASMTSGPGRRVLLLAVPPETPTAPVGGQTPASREDDRCRGLRPARRSPQRPIRLEAATTEGASRERLRVRFPYLAVGTWVLCTQVIEADDPEPEAVDAQTIVVRESRACLDAKAAIADRRDDLRLIRRRREVLERRIRERRREVRAASSSQQAATGRARAATDAARLRSYETGTKAMSQLIKRVRAGARTYCPDL